MKFSKREIKIFLTFFIIYSFFIHWSGWNENSRFALTRAIVEEQRFAIDSWANQTSDRAFFNDHYYTDKAPGTSFLATPVYGLWRLVYNFFPSPFKKAHSGSEEYITTIVGENRIPIIDKVNLGFFILFSMILITIFTASLFSSLTVLLIYKISKYFTEKEKHRLFLSFVGGLGTLIFPYATLFLDHAVATFFGFLGFYILFKSKNEKIRDKRYPILAGLSLGYALTSSAVMSIVGGICLVYLVYLNKKMVAYFLIGGLLGILPFLIYNQISFGTPFTLPRHHLDQQIWVKLGGIHGLQTPNPFVMLRLLFYPHKGLLFYYPVLLLSFIGLWYMFKEHKIESKLILLVFLGFLVMNSAWWAWWGGAFFGPRHLTPVMPFLVLPLAYVFKNFDQRKSYIVILSLIGLSIFINFMSLQPGEDRLISEDKISMAPKYRRKINTLQIIAPFYQDLLRFIRIGPRSRILENLMNNKNLDIRFFGFEEREGFTEFYYHIPYLPLLVVGIIALIIWRNETFLLIKNLSKEQILLISGIFLILIVSILTLSLKKTEERFSFGKGWYPPSEKGRWLKERGEITIYADHPKLFRFKTLISSYYWNRQVEVFFNDRLIDEFRAYGDQVLEYSQLLKLESGNNKLQFRVKEECDIPNIVENKSDKRCLGISLRNVSIETPRDIVFSSGWYPEDPKGKGGRWMLQNGSITFFNEDTSELFRFSTSIISYHKDTDLKVYFNHKFVDSLKVRTDQELEYGLVLNAKPGRNKLKFEALSDCRKPSVVENGSDIRCLNVRFSNIKIKWNKIYAFNKNWYPLSEKGRWMLQNGSIVILNPLNTTKLIVLRSLVGSYHRDRDVSVYLNGNLLDKVTIRSNQELEYSTIFNIKPGLNTLKFVTNPSCEISREPKDVRCLSIYFKNTSIKKFRGNYIFSKDWYPTLSEEGKWMKEDGEILAFNPTNESRLYKLSSILESYFRERKVKFFLNNNLKDEFSIPKGQRLNYTWLVNLKPGKNTLRFYTSCNIPKMVENSSDTRCLSIRAIDLSIEAVKEPLIFGKYWYPKTEEWIWMRQNGTLNIVNLDHPKRILLSFHTKSSIKDRVVNVYLNDRDLTSFLSFRHGNKITIPLTLKSGVNTLKLSTKECSKNLPDVRCLSVSLANISISSPEEFNESYIFSSGWYPKEKEERWMMQDGTLLFYNPKNITQSKYLSARMSSYYQDRRVRVYFNGRVLDEIKVYTDELIYNLPLELKPGINKLTFHSTPDCDIPYELNESEDKRCLSIKFKNTTVQSLNKTLLLGKYWYPKTEEWIWMRQNGTIFIPNSSKLSLLKIISGSFYRNRTVEIYRNNEFLRNEIVPTTGVEMILPLFDLEGKTVIRLHTKEKCDIPAKVMDSTDTRCLSISLSNLTAKFEYVKRIEYEEKIGLENV